MKMTKFGDKNGENPKESRYKKKQERKKEGNKDIKHASCFWRKRKKNLDTMKQRISNKAHNSIFWREEYLKKYFLPWQWSCLISLKYHCAKIINYKIYQLSEWL